MLGSVWQCWVVLGSTGMCWAALQQFQFYTGCLGSQVKGHLDGAGSAVGFLLIPGKERKWHSFDMERPGTWLAASSVGCQPGHGESQ